MTRIITLKKAISEKIINNFTDSVELDCNYPYTRVTEWYYPHEFHMLGHAINQLAGCQIMLVLDENKLCICRNSKQMKETITEEI